MGSVQLFQIASNRGIARDTYLLELDGDTVGLEHPGQFVNIEVPGFYLRRPLSVCNWRPGRLTLMYKVLGQGTAALTEIGEGTRLSVLSGLGNGFWLPQGVVRPLVVGGGIGVAPMLALVESLLSDEVMPQVVLGFGSADEVALVDEIASLSLDGQGVPVTVSTVDGTRGVPGFVTDAMDVLRQEAAEQNEGGPAGPSAAAPGGAGRGGQSAGAELSSPMPPGSGRIGRADVRPGETALGDRSESSGETAPCSAGADEGRAVPGFAGGPVRPWDYVYACGPTPMLKAVFATAGTPGQYSMEERMACGFGACMGCVLETTEGMQRICKEGPVFASEVLPW